MTLLGIVEWLVGVLIGLSILQAILLSRVLQRIEKAVGSIKPTEIKVEPLREIIRQSNRVRPVDRALEAIRRSHTLCDLGQCGHIHEKDKS